MNRDYVGNDKMDSVMNYNFISAMIKFFRDGDVNFLREKIEEVKSAIKKEPVSLDTLVTDDLSIQDYIEDTTYISPEASTQMKLQEKDITKLIGHLDKREQEIIKRRFGIDDEEPKTLEQIGNALGFSKERIRQIENLAIQKLRKVENIECLRTYLDCG